MTKILLLQYNWGPSSEFVSSSIPSWQILTAHVQPFREARDLAFCLRVPLDSLLVWASSGGSGKTVRMRRLAWTFTAHIGDKYQIRLTRPNCNILIVIILPKTVSKNSNSLLSYANWRTKQVIFQRWKKKVTINRNITQNAIFIPHNATFCDGIWNFLNFNENFKT